MDDKREKERVGLCFDCRHARMLRSDRGSVFYQCQRAEDDASYARYPRLTVLVCAGYEGCSESHGLK